MEHAIYGVRIISFNEQKQVWIDWFIFQFSKKIHRNDDDNELGDGRFDRFSSVRRTRRLRKAPEGAEEDSSTNLEPRKSPEGVEDPDEMSNAHDVIVGMEVKKVRLICFLST